MSNLLDEILREEIPRIEVPNGDILKVIDANDLNFNGFGEAYFSIINQNSIKAWKKHERMTLNLVVPKGKVKFIFFDGKNVFRQEIIGLGCYARLTIPPKIWFGFQGISSNDSLVLNIADTIHDPLESSKKDLHEIKFNWES